MAPGVNDSGKHTGTVPKSKTQNDGRRDSDSRRENSINNIPNNLAPFDWQPISDSSQKSTLKTSNTGTCVSDAFDFDGASLSEAYTNRRRYFIPDEQGINATYLPVGYPPASIKPSTHPRHLRHNSRLHCYTQPSFHSTQGNHSNAPTHMIMASDEDETHMIGGRNGSTQEWVDHGGGGENRASRDHVSPSTSEQQLRRSKSRDERDRNILPDQENKSNISKMPDRNQVLSRLNQIRDYINQTTSLMGRMQNSRDPRVAAEYMKLVKMRLGLRDSEKKLEDLLSTLKNLAECGELDVIGDAALENLDFDHLQRFTQLLEVLKKQEDMYLHLCSRNWIKMKQDNPDLRALDRIRKDFNSQTANAGVNSVDMAGAVAKSAEAGHRNELRAKFHKPEMEPMNQVEMVNPVPDFSTSNEIAKLARKGKLDQLKDRIQALKELYENRNQLIELLGDEDEELSSEHNALKYKLEDLQLKKNHMDQLVQELRSLNSLISDEDVEQQNDPVNVETFQEIGNDAVDSEQPEHDIQEVLKSMEELKQLKQRLDALQGSLAIPPVNQNQASGADILENGSATPGEVEEHAINLRRQREQISQQLTAKPDNISLSSEVGSVTNSDARQLYISTCELERKKRKLQEAKSRLQQLEKLLDVVQDNRKDGLSLSNEQFSQLMKAVAEDECMSANQSQRDDSKDQEMSLNVAEDQTLQSSQNKHGSQMSEDIIHDNQRLQQFSRSRTSSAHGSEDVDSRLRPISSPGTTTELSVEALKAMTQNLLEETMTIRAERERLAAVKWQLTQRQRQEPAASPPPSSSASTSSSASASVHTDKNRNAVGMETQSCRQLLLQAELQAKRRELEELMRKDRGHLTSINQDICSGISANKSENPGFSNVTMEGTTTNATWGGSTQGTLEDLAERDIEVQDQNGDYSSDEGRNGEETKEGVSFQQTTSIQDARLSTLNISLAREQPNGHSQSAHRENLPISIETQGRSKTSISSNNCNSNASSTLTNIHSGGQTVARSTPRRSPARISQNQHLQQNSQNSTPVRAHISSSHNLWKKDSSVENAGPRAVWTPGHTRQENLCSADELVADSGAGSNTGAAASSIQAQASSLNSTPQVNPSAVNQHSSVWWQQQVQQLQHQLEATTSMCQSLMMEQQHQNNNPGGPYPGFGLSYNLAHGHPLGYATPSTNPTWPFSTIGSPLMFNPSPIFPGSDPSQSSFTFHTCAYNQLQQQQVLLTLSHCCHLLSLQHRELASLQAAVQGMQERSGHESRHEEDDLRNIHMQHQPVHSHAASYHNRMSTPTAHGVYSIPVPVTQSSSSHSLSRRLQKPPQTSAIYPDSVREGIIASDTHGTAASGVSSAHSLPNLCAPGSAMMGLHHLIPQTETHPSAGAAYPFHSESLPPPIGPTSYGHTDHWGMHPGAAGVARGPPVALNNQVPPGIRANNYWDNFRSYSRQNLLSTSSKSNEGFPHIPSPLVMRSNNFLRTATHGPPIQPPGLNAAPGAASQAARLPTPCQKEKLNTEFQPEGAAPMNANRSTPNPLSAVDGIQYGAEGFSSQEIPWETHHSSQPSIPKEDHVTTHEDTNRRRSTRERGGLFEVLRESVYSEVATLIAQNENRPHYLIQLFKDLQMVSCDALRQRTLHTIHQIVSKYIQENGKETHSRQQSSHSMDPEQCLSVPRECESSGDEEIQSQEISHAVEGDSAEACQSHNDNMDENIQSMLHQLLPLLKPHLNEPSSFMLLQNICLLAFQFLSSNLNAEDDKAKENTLSPSLSFHQLNSLLEETCLRFEGCKLKDVGEELLTCIGEVLVKAISAANHQEQNISSIHEEAEGREDENEIEVTESANTKTTSEERFEAEIEEINENCFEEDLAEADQSIGSAIGINSEVTEIPGKCSKEVEAEPKDGDAESSSLNGEETFIVIVKTEKEKDNQERRDGDEKLISGSAFEKAYSTSEFVECNGNNEGICCGELGAQAIIDQINISVDESKNQTGNKAEALDRSGMEIIKERESDNMHSRLLSATPSTSTLCVPKSASRTPNGEIAESQWNEKYGNLLDETDTDINKNTRGNAGYVAPIQFTDNWL